MSVSADEREALHMMLDAILNSRAYLERMDTSELQPGAQFSKAWSTPRGDLFTQASKLIRRAIGPQLHQAELNLLFEAELEESPSDAELMATISNAIRTYLPLFMKEGTDEWRDTDEVIVRIIEDFMGIHWGDEPRFFTVYPKRQGQHKRLYRLNRLRLSALDWDKYLDVVGLTACERHNLISTAYRTDWDAIRKWSGAIESQYGFCSSPPRYPDNARKEYAENPEKVMAAIQRDGDAYWQEKTSAKQGK